MTAIIPAYKKESEIAFDFAISPHCALQFYSHFPLFLQELQPEPENDCSSSSYYQEDELSSALSRPGEFTLAENIQILPHLPKYSICITKKGPSEFLGNGNYLGN